MGDYYRNRGYRDGDSRRNTDDMSPLPTLNMMGSRIYVGKLPPDLKEKEIEKVFIKYGEIREISLKGNYCFIQYESNRSSKEAVMDLHGKTLFGETISVEHARVPKEYGYNARGPSAGYRTNRTYGYDSRNSYRPRRRSPPPRSRYRVNVSNLSTRCDRRDLKAVMEKAGRVVYTEAHRRKVGEGFVEFETRRDMERAVDKLDGLEINAKPIKLVTDDDRRRSRSQSRSRSRSRSKSRSKARSKSRSNSKSRSRSRSRRSRSAERSNDVRKRKESEENRAEDKKDTKSDDEEFEQAERNVLMRKKNLCLVEAYDDNETTETDRERSPQAAMGSLPTENDTEQERSAKNDDVERSPLLGDAVRSLNEDETNETCADNMESLDDNGYADY